MNKANELLFFILLLTAVASHGQSLRKSREFRGIVRDIQSGHYFAYSLLTIEEQNGFTDLLFPPEHGRTIITNFKVGDSIVLKADARSKPVSPAERKLMKEHMLYFMMGSMEAVRINGVWQDLAWRESHPSSREGFVFLNREVTEVYKKGPHPRAVKFARGVVGFYPGPFAKKLNPLNGVEVGDKLSFVGRQYTVWDGGEYPMEGVHEVYGFQRLERASGTIRSLLFKQNYVCIGISVSTNRGEMKASFPTELAKDVQKFADGREVDIYVTDFKVEGQLHPPELHAIVSGADTLVIKELGFYGGADGNHEHVPVKLQGKVTAVDKSDAGNTTGVIIDNQTFVEIDGSTGRQLANVLRRGKMLEISGDERIKKDGEIYSKDYRIVIPNQITVDGKVFLINTRP